MQQRMTATSDKTSYLTMVRALLQILHNYGNGPFAEQGSADLIIGEPC